MSNLYNDSVFWIETQKINPNPYQPRKEFNEEALRDLADSIRQYGVLQPLVVTRTEIAKDDGGMVVGYELIAGERRLRAAQLAGIHQVPVIIRQGDDSKMKLELAIIENLQREDLNPIDRALAFKRLIEEFDLTHAQVGKKMGKSREYVSNSLRLLQLPSHMQQALVERRIAEGHTRPLMMLSDRPEQQETLFKEIVYKKMSVRESEKVARGIATDKVRKKDIAKDPRIKQYQETLSTKLGTRVQIDEKEVGGKIIIDYFSPDDLQIIIDLVRERGDTEKATIMENFLQESTQKEAERTPLASDSQDSAEPEESIYGISNFSV